MCFVYTLAFQDVDMGMNGLNMLVYYAHSIYVNVLVDIMLCGR